MSKLVNEILGLCDKEPDVNEAMVAPLTAFVMLGQQRGIGLEALGEFVQSTMRLAQSRGLGDPTRGQT